MMDFNETPVVRVTYPEPFPKEYKPSKAQLERLALAFAKAIRKEYEAGILDEHGKRIK